MLVNAVKDVAMALGDLIHATKAASGKSIHDPAMTSLKESAKVSIGLNLSLEATKVISIQVNLYKIKGLYLFFP